MIFSNRTELNLIENRLDSKKGVVTNWISLTDDNYNWYDKEIEQNMNKRKSKFNIELSNFYGMNSQKINMWLF